MCTTPPSQTDLATSDTPTLGTPTLASFTGYEAFPKLPPRVLPLTTFGKSKPGFEWDMTDEVSDLLHAQYRLSLLQWNVGAARRRPTQLVTAMCGAFNAVPLQEAHDHIPHISDQSNKYSDDGGLAILLNKDTFLADAVKCPIIEEAMSRTTWGLTVLVVCGHLGRPPVGARKTVTFCSVHLHNVVAKKRDAATSLFQRLYAHMKILDVDFVGGDFNKAMKGPVSDVFSDAEFMAPGSSPLWGAGGLEGAKVDCTGFLCMPRRPFHWLINKHGVHTFSNDQLGLHERDEGTHYPVFMHLWATNLPGGTPSGRTKRRSTSEAALEGHNKERA